ncbi:MAG: glycosyltransferase family 2 protein [Cyclobacteriaceae bacterium]|nr:glycosyltransferase family 2 protein [Cyclobacteriaceae bacterium]
MEKLAVVILNYNGRHYLQKFLPTVLRYSSDFPVYVADNFSTDNSVAFLRKEFPSVRLIEFKNNYGFSEGYNRALDQISAGYYMLLNSDVEVTPDWLIPMVELLDRNPEIAACQPKLLQYNRRSHFEYAGAAGGFIDKYGYPFCRGRIFTTMERDYGQYDDTRPVFWASGACMLVRSSFFRELGGFDPDFFAHMEEIDLCWRLLLSGYAIYYCGESVVYHVGGGTLHQSNPFKTYLNFRNSLITLVKNSKKKGLYLRLFMRGIFDLIACHRFLLFNSPGDFLSVVRANVHVYKKFLYTLKKREKIKRNNNHPGNIYRRSIVLSY